MGNELVRVHGVTRISVPKLGVLVRVSQEWVTSSLQILHIDGRWTEKLPLAEHRKTYISVATCTQ